MNTIQQALQVRYSSNIHPSTITSPARTNRTAKSSRKEHQINHQKGSLDPNEKRSFIDIYIELKNLSEKSKKNPMNIQPKSHKYIY